MRSLRFLSLSLYHNSNTPKVKIITYYKSATGTRFNHVIYNEEVSLQSQSSLLLLNDYFRELDEDFLKVEKELQEYLNKRYIFLLKTKRNEGDLVCHYCHKPHLEIGYRSVKMCNLNNKNSKLATIDHKVPVSSGIDKLDVKNWVVSCKKCNNRKGSKSYDEFKKNHLKK